MSPDHDTPVGTRLRLVRACHNRPIGETAVIINRSLERFANIRWDIQNPVAQADGGYPFYYFEIIDDLAIQVGDTVKFEGVVQYITKETAYFKSKDGSHYFAPLSNLTFVKRTDTKLKVGDVFKYRQNKSYEVLETLLSGNNLCRELNTTSNYKLIHNNDAEISR